MRLVWLTVVWAISCPAYELRGRIEPPITTSVFLQDANTPFENSVETDGSGHFEFHKLPAGTYTLAVSTTARGQLRQTVELSSSTADAKGHLELVLRMDDPKLYADGGRSTGAIISATVLSIAVRALKEYEEARHCLSRPDSECAMATFGARFR